MMHQTTTEENENEQSVEKNDQERKKWKKIHLERLELVDQSKIYQGVLIWFPCLLFVLWILRNEIYDSLYYHSLHYDQQEKDNSILLKTSVPVVRIYRVIMELICVMGFATAVSLHIWSNIVGRRVVQELLFQFPSSEAENQQQNHVYQPISTFDDYSFEGEEDDEHDIDDLTGAHLHIHRTGEQGDSSEHFETTHRQAGNPHPKYMEPPTPIKIIHTLLRFVLWTMISLCFFALTSSLGRLYIPKHDAENKTNKLRNTLARLLANWIAPAIPVALFLWMFFQTVFPWKKNGSYRRHFWRILSFTMGAPLYSPVTFRDGFLGDILTSSVRPLQDVAYIFCYLTFGIFQDVWNLHIVPMHNPDAVARTVDMAQSWWIRTLLLPACTISPLWWRFCQNLRQSFDARCRWPYLGNALKYLLAAQVASMATFYPTTKSSNVSHHVLWWALAVGSTLYQIWWDVFMDWQLLDNQGRVRSRRLFHGTRFYWIILCVNIVLRFGWTLTFLPKQYLNPYGILEPTTFQGIFRHVDPILASAELIRRMLWGFLRVEWEAISQYGDQDMPSSEYVQQRLAQVALSDSKSAKGTKSEEDKIDDETMMPSPLQLPSSFDFQNSGETTQINRLLLVPELVLWATVFLGGAILAGAHRNTY